MSDLIGVFGDENDRIVRRTSDVVFGKDTTLNLSSLSSISVCSNSSISTLSSKKTEFTQISKDNHFGSKTLFMEEKRYRWAVIGQLD